jgi:hypothetical protein
MKAVAAILFVFMIFFVNSSLVIVGHTGYKVGAKYFCNSCGGDTIKLDAYVTAFEDYKSYLCTPYKRTNCNCSTLRLDISS